MEKKPKRLYTFGPFHLDTGERLLLRDGAVVPLKPKAFDVLLALLDQPGRLLEKETLLETVWPDSFVEENNLADNISQLRKALGEGENGQKFIETVPKRGYRFIADVHTAKDTILLADFENKTGDEIFDKTLKQGLAIQLRQSPFLNLFPEAQTRHELKLMRRSPDERVTAEIAHEICERQNLKAFIAGSIAPLGSHYVITLEAINGQSGEPLAQEQVEVENKEQTLQALSRAATRLRERLGESLSSIRRFDRPLVEGTTSKLEAFKAFSQGVELTLGGQLREAITSYKHATEIDPEFAHAYGHLALMLYATGRPELAAEYAQKAYQLKDRAGEFEKIRINIWYHGLCAGDLNKRIEMAKLHKRTYPRDVTGPNDLAVAYILLGRYDQALPQSR
jgi:DNA-binding winged helix-turn-helix (wHTH) protein